MFSKIRSLIFKLDPETAHDLAITALKFNPIPQGKIKNNKSIQTEIFGKTIPNPIGIAAGFDKDAEVYNPLFKLGFGFVEVGTVTPVGQYGNPKPRIFRLEEDMALINRLGFNNSGSEKVRSRIISNSPKGLFGINIGPNKDTINRLEDYLICFRKFYNLADYSTKSALRDQILVERGWEFHAEGHRRRSLIRHGSFISGAQARGKTNAQPHHVLFPIPEQELDSNTSLEQNPGY